MQVITSREFNQDVSHAKRAARIEPVFITDRGKPTHVLISIDAYRDLSGQKASLVELLAAPDLPDLDLSPARSPWEQGAF